MKRRASILVALMVALAISVSGCISGTSSPPPDEAPATEVGGEVEWWTINLQANYADYIQGLIDTYEKENPGTTIKWVDVPGADLSTKLLAAFAAGTPPDLVNIASPDLGRFQKSLTDLHDYLTPEQLAAYQTSLVTPLEQDGKLTALPWYNGGSPVAIYRQSAMKGTSFDAKNPPKDFDAVLSLAEEVKKKNDVAGMNSIPSANVLPFYGVKMLNDDRTKAAFNTPETIDILKRWKSAYDSGAIAQGAIDKDTRNLPQNLENRRVGFVVNVPATQLVNTKNNAPEVYQDLVVAPSARTPDGKLLLAGQQTFAIPSDSDNKATAADWLRFVTSAENQLAFCKIVAIFPSTKATLEDPFFENEGDEPADQARQIIVDTLPDLEDGALATSKDAQLAEMFDEQVRAFLQGDVDAATALGKAEKLWNGELAR